MKVLWITNILFPAPCMELNIPSPVVGGWMYASAKALIDLTNNIDLAVATVYSGADIKCFKISGITYYMLPLKGLVTKYHKLLEQSWQAVVNEFNPDLVHLHGTEYPHSLAFLNACPQIKSVVSIQGLISVYERYYYAGISNLDIIKNITFRDFVRMDSIFQQRWKLIKRGKIEREIIRKINHVIGRTTWDKAHSFAINPNVNYYFCNETLRPSFYKNKWDYDKCEKYSIFLSQAGTPIKGLHQVLKALPNVIKNYPDTHLYISGTDITKYSTLTDKFRLSGYGKYIRSLISKLRLDGYVTFTGPLNENQMVERYLRSNLFICPSSIENSPNSLGEAQILGVPCIASVVGGVQDMIVDGQTGLLYRFEEIEILSLNIMSIFNKSLILDSKDISLLRHNSLHNNNELISIYNSIIDCK